MEFVLAERNAQGNYLESFLETKVSPFAPHPFPEGTPIPVNSDPVTFFLLDNLPQGPGTIPISLGGEG